MAEVDEKTGVFPEEDRMKRAQVARRLKCDPRTVGRMAEDGELTRDAEGNFSREEVELMASSDPQDHISEALRLANSHVERTFQLVEKPLKTITDALVSFQEQSRVRETEREATHIETLRVLGELLVQKEEREAIKVQAQAKAEMLSKAGQQVVSMLPLLMQQLAATATKGKKNPVKDFFDTLTDDEKEQILTIGEVFEGEKKVMWDAMMSSIQS